MIKYFKNIIISILYWFSPPKIGRIEIEPIQSQLDQDVRKQQDKIEINLEDWEDTIQSVFETDDFAGDGFHRSVRPTDEVLKRQIQIFFKDYRRINGKIEQLYTKTIKSNEDS